MCKCKSNSSNARVVHFARVKVSCKSRVVTFLLLHMTRLLLHMTLITINDTGDCFTLAYEPDSKQNYSDSKGSGDLRPNN